MTTKLIAVAALVSLTFCGAATDARAAGSSATRSAPTILPSDIQGKWAWVYEENMSLQATCDDPESKGIVEITGDRIDGYELGMKALNATGMVGTPKGDQWKVLVSMSIEGELISDTLTILKYGAGNLSIAGQDVNFSNLQKCGEF
jgi:hypothetical protein